MHTTGTIVLLPTSLTAGSGSDNLHDRLPIVIKHIRVNIQPNQVTQVGLLAIIA